LLALSVPVASTESWIQGFYDAYNELYFSGQLPAGVRVTVEHIPQHGIMGATVSCDSPSGICIVIDPKWNPDGKEKLTTLLHEMCHVKFWHNKEPDGIDGHGPRFHKELRRLMDFGAFDDLL
jgi:SprT-like family protein